MNLGRILTGLILIEFVVMSVMAGDTDDRIAHWTAGSSTKSERPWTTATSWKDNVVPGRYYADSVLEGSIGWTAYIDGGKDYLLEIPNTFYSVSNVVIMGTSGVWMLGNSQWNPLPLENGGMLKADSSYTKDIQIRTPIGFAEIPDSGGAIHVRNDMTDHLLDLQFGFNRGWTRQAGHTSVVEPIAYLEGCGDIRLQSGFPGNNAFRPYMALAMTSAKVIVTNANSFSNLQTLYVPAGVGKQTLQIEPNSIFQTGSLASARQIDARSDLDIVGDGTLVFNANGNSGILVASGVTVRVATEFKNIQTSPTLNFGASEGIAGGLIKIEKSNDIAASASIEKVLVEVSSIGGKGTSGALGTGQALTLSNTGSLRFVGGTETTDRDIYTSGSGSVMIAATNAASLTLTGDVKMSWPSTMIFDCGDADTTMAFSGSFLDQSGNGYRPDITKAGLGTLTVSGDNVSMEVARRPNFLLTAGTLVLGSETAAANVHVKSTGTILKVAAAQHVALELVRKNSGTVSVVLEAEATLKPTNLTRGDDLTWITVNGRAAYIDADGYLQPRQGLLIFVK